MSNQSKDELKVIPEITLWKKAKVSSCEMEFSCGGDSMNDYSFRFFNEKGKEIKENKVSELKDYFEDAVFHNVEFYVNSESQYMGEFGTVTITLNEEENEFEYEKNARAEYSESFTENVGIPITKSEAKFLNEFVDSIFGEEDAQINYKKDLIVGEKEEKLIKGITSKVKEFGEQYQITNTSNLPEDAEEDDSGWFRITTAEQKENDELKIDENNNLWVEISKTYRYTQESN